MDSFSTFFSDFNVTNFQLDNTSSISLYLDCTLLKYILKITKKVLEIFLEVYVFCELLKSTIEVLIFLLFPPLFMDEFIFK